MACQAQEKASDGMHILFILFILCLIWMILWTADIAAMMKHEIPSTQEGKCFHSCMQSKLGVVSYLNYWRYVFYYIKY